jgi:hypothetical protein
MVVAVAIAAGLIVANLGPDRVRRISTSPTIASPPTTSLTTTSAPSTTGAPTTVMSTTIPPAHAKSDVTVIVVNAGILPLKGATLTNTLRQAGYAPLRPVGDTVDRPRESAVVYAPGYEGDATALALVVGIGHIAPLSQSPLPAGVTQSVNVMVVIGTDLKS